MTEDWKYITGFEGRYQISTFGRIRSFCRPRQKILKIKCDKHGYPTAFLKRGNKAECLLVHRIVAKHFIPNPENKPEVNHKDFNRANNRVDNLEWCTGRENRAHARLRPGRVIKSRAEIKVKKYLKMEIMTRKVVRTRVRLKKVIELDGSYWYGVWINRSRQITSFGADLEKAKAYYNSIT